ncbi:Zinc protease [uncultured Synechococcales cyanobacterium]|uniref:Zinc protease n=1 Tax=uncultured Synechococcales cyanobacterium TaxID=1936017 RepID=A0A6J4ULM3_9CYAN|nr:Zinc protease [uncultured Synechococcales cyanobacterium]
MVLQGLSNRLRYCAVFLLLLLGLGFISAPAWARTAAKPSTAAPANSVQPYLDRVAKRVTDFRLDNGLRFIVLERHEAPVVSFLTYADVGGANEPEGKTGVAHFLEHLAFKGTTRIGTRNYEAEQRLLNRLDQLFAQIQASKAAGESAKVATLQAEFDKVESQAASYVKQNELGQIVEQAGGVGLNANTSTDATRYFYSFPANKLELWMSLESERFLEPVYREFYKEKEVILEERRLRTDNSPIGQMIEAFLAKAYTVHPYRRPVIGYAKDIQNLTRQDVQKFFETYYVPSNLAIAVVGDVDPAEVKRLAELYFGRYPAKPMPAPVTAVEPPQTVLKEVTLRLPSQPWYIEGYHRPALNHPDRVVYEMLTGILTDGRTSRLYQSLVEKRLALNAVGANGFPGEKYPSLLLFYALTAPDRTVEEVGTKLHSEIERLKTQLVSAPELDRVKTQARAGLLQSLNSNQGMAELLLEYEVKTGSWRNLFQELTAIAAVTPVDIQRVAQATFQPQNRTVGKILPLAETQQEKP